MNAKLTELLAEVFGLRPTEIHAELQKTDVGSWDSLKQMDLVMSLERAYDIVLDLPDILRMTSVAEIVAVLEDKGVSFED
ncbi:acyl carrier protein [uncultured Roseibium sp.]|uniref:acyl carrier protein n=1 Tax=uncultured Roseibium sp. TaxID=1936171 RepID=UPI0026300C7C|nr:acyl carrier protein [uncultured Roseibium sp.]